MMKRKAAARPQAASVPPFPCQRIGGTFLYIDKNIHKHYNIYKYNTKGNTAVSTPSERRCEV